jgi:serine/threonine-protein kinase
MGNGSKRLGRYRLIADIGHGGMAEVYLALLEGDLGFNKLLVIKKIRPELAEDPEMMGMFLDEARLSARLHHPNVVETHEVAQEDGHTFMAMEYLEGQSLHRILHRLRREGGLPQALHLQILADVLAGLHHAHELCDWDETPLGVVHRDVTPQNVFVTYDGRVKVVDFGIAKVRGASSETRAGVVKGKVAYMAPEQARGEPVDRRTDLFAAGVMLWEAATHSRPFRGLSDVEILHRLIHGEIPSARSANPAIPDALEAIVKKATAPIRADRYATAAELRAAIEGYLETVTDRPPPRELGRLVTLHFAEDRARLKHRLEEELRENPAGSASVPRFAAPEVLHDEPSSDPAVAGQSTRRQRSQPGTGASLPGVTRPSAPRPVGRRRVVVAAIFVAAVLAASAALWLPWKAPPPAPPPPSPSPIVAIATIAAPTPAPPEPRRIALRLRASPLDARIYLDGAALDGNPFAGVFPVDAASHELRIEAPHHVTRRQMLSLDQDSTLEIVLSAEPEAPPTRPNPPPARPPRGAPQPRGERGKRSLDGANPYEQ